MVLAVAGDDSVGDSSGMYPWLVFHLTDDRTFAEISAKNYAADVVYYNGTENHP